MTKERELEAQLLQAQKLESLGTLVGGIAHDFNNMLTGILGYAQLLLREVESSSPSREGLHRIELLSERAADMVRQLLAFSRRAVGQKKNLALHPFLKEMIKLLPRMIPESIEIDLILAHEDIRVEADPTQLHQVVMNVAVNARDAMADGGQLRIETAVVELDDLFCEAHPGIHPGRYVRLSVSDTGVGIPPEIRSRIFDPFFTTKPVGKGTGLGLPVVYGIVANHGGAIDIQSAIGRGTSIHIYLPVTEAPAVEAASPSIEILEGTETILFVEDDPRVLEFGTMALEFLGYRVLTAHDGLEALEVFQEHSTDIAAVFSDIVMPRMSGDELVVKLRQLNPTIPILLATGYTSAPDTAEILVKTGVCGLVRKPYQIHELAQAIRAILDRPQRAAQPG